VIVCVEVVRGQRVLQLVKLDVSSMEGGVGKSKPRLLKTPSKVRLGDRVLYGRLQKTKITIQRMPK
jgi:hypothetical protein